jgi:N-methylhydantoinase B
MVEGDCLRLETPGGGGYGAPGMRSAEAVLEDVRRGYYCREAAETEYGVVIEPEALEVDGPATTRMRNSPTRTDT